MAKSTTSSFVTEVPLKVGTHEFSILKKRFWAAKQQYNALLGEAMRRLSKMRKDPEYQSAIVRYKKGEKKEAKTIFKGLEKKYAYREYDLYGYCKQWNKKGSFLSIGARISQQLAKRAFNACQEYKLGKRGKPRFKGRSGVLGIEESGIANIRIKENKIGYLGIELPLIYDKKDPVHAHGKSSRIKYVRIVRRNLHGKMKYFAQLVCEGVPFVKEKNSVVNGTVGIDIGPQTIAIVSKEKKYACLKVFADEIKLQKIKKKNLERAIARKLRLSNPECYEKDKWVKKDKTWCRKKGKSIKGKWPSKRSRSLQRSISNLANLSRKQASHRKSQHGFLANQVLSIGAIT